eukprot:117213_1
MAFAFAGLVFVPTMMAMGLSSAPLIFTVFMWFVVSAIRLAHPSLMFHYIPESDFDRSVFQREADLIFKDNRVYFPLVLYYMDDIFGVHTKEHVHEQYRLAGETLNYLGLSAKVSKDRPPNT